MSLMELALELGLVQVVELESARVVESELGLEQVVALGSVLELEEEV